MANSHTSDTSPQRFRRGTAVSERLRDVSFPTAVRGYDRRAVDEFIDELRGLVADLESHQTREGVVQKALDELGEETAGILQRAHETADEIAARSRAQADGRLQRAEREAEIVKRDADEYSEQVVTDTRLLWEERQRLIEDIRHLADEVLGTADDAMERLKLPEPLAAAEQEAEATTGEASVTPIPHPLSVAPEPDPAEDPSVPYDLEAPDEEQEGAEPWAPASEEDAADPDATVAWSTEADDEQDPDATAPWPAGDEEPDQPGAASPWPAGDVEPDQPGAASPWPAGDEEPDQPGAASDADDPGTVELEALPGGNADEQTAEHEHKRD